MKVSIIVSCFNNTRTATHMSMLCLDHIRKFTDPPYQLIVVDPVPKFPIRDDYKTLGLENDPDTIWAKFPTDIGYTAGMNKGAELATGEVLVFIQNDVFVREHWLPDLLWYIKDGWDVVFPDQVPRSREYVKESYTREHSNEFAKKGGRDAGLMMITKSAFDKVKWNPELSLLAERDFYERMSKAGIRWIDTNKVLITHIMAATNLEILDTNPNEYEKRMTKDAEAMNK